MRAARRLRLCAHYDAGWTAAKNVRPFGLWVLGGRIGMRSAIDYARPPQAQGQPRWKSSGRVVDLPRDWGPFVLGRAPCVSLDICPYAPRVPGRLPDGLSGDGCPNVTAPHPVACAFVSCGSAYGTRRTHSGKLTRRPPLNRFERNS
jgi:hypothetical protein